MTRPARGELNAAWGIGVAVVGPLWRLLFRQRSLGTEHIPRSGPGIVAANHVSALDGIALALVNAERAGRMTRFLAAAEFFSKRRFGWALRLYRQIPVRRGQRDVAALDEAIATVGDGALAGIFPEGHVNPGDPTRPQRGHTGVARIALATGAPVIPAGIWGTQTRWPRTGLTWRRPFRPTVAIAYGRQVAPVGDVASQADLDAFSGVVMAAIGEQLELARRLAERSS